jgi:hypothetical protein
VYFHQRLTRIYKLKEEKTNLIWFEFVGDNDAHSDFRGIIHEELSLLSFNKVDINSVYNDILQTNKFNLQNDKYIEQRVS